MTEPIIFQAEPLTNRLLSEVLEYGKDHLKEVGSFKDMEPNVWEEWYGHVAASGGLRIFTARNGQLVGYAVFFVSPHRHFRDVMQATQDLIYLAPTARRGLTGLIFLRWCDEQLRDEGVELVYQYSSDSHDIGPVLKRIGYDSVQVLWARKLSEGGLN